jgi:hypothetical protein
MKLSENLTLAEVIRSESAKRFQINNNPTAEHLENLKLLATHIFQPMRDHFGVPIHISSGYRSLALNKRIGGARNSQHSTGQALDIDMQGTKVSNADIFNWAKDNLKFDQLIWEFGDDTNPDWVHISYAKKPRKQILKAKRNGLQTVYSKY